MTDPTDPARPLEGKVALVTGGSRGLGRETVLAFARAGADVVIASRDHDSCEALAATVRSETGRRALAFGCHVGRWDELDDLVEASYAEFGRVDVLVNNAGMSPVYDTPADVSKALWDKVVDVNLAGPFRLMAAVGARMAAGEGGSIINVSSVAGTNPTPHVLPYAAAKAGLDALTVGFARAFGPTVRVNGIVPGTFLTDIAKAWDQEAFARESAGFALQRGGRPDEIVGAMLYFATAASSYTTGSLLRVDGGYLQPAE
ncbi:SDR family NAD(P)-dependent oxidoreductase [Patulibacter sp.]|uniref:SDR family NAD(P)-dependent oxidoreductase n=1 Tax=Patulibacter sp. TaxID=1912859 RepID=UPI00271A3E35|nr:glucose 1-dehydrogenase [Patulibacter sp.]MDO9410829.1 glucose 1-dehydrogenase [Patulibacter sp.]